MAIRKGETMNTQSVTLDYLPQFEAFGISDQQILSFDNQNITPLISLSIQDINKLGIKTEIDAPTVAFLLGRDDNHYTIDYNYAKAILQSGVNIRFLTYSDCIEQMQGVHALILPGGRFPSPEQFYIDAAPNASTNYEPRATAYINCIAEAIKQRLPMLGICAGAQMIGGMLGMKMYRNTKRYVLTDIEHKTDILDAHKVFIKHPSPLFDILQKEEMETNSRHTESMLPSDTNCKLSIYAHTDDNVPEAWGCEDDHILCIQWHPEDFAAKGDDAMQRIYNWLALQAEDYMKKNPAKID